MILPLGKLKYNDREINFWKDSHTNVSREGNGFVRDQFLNEERYMRIFSEVMKQGFMSFGIYKPELILIAFKDAWGLHYSILAERNANSVVVKTVYTSKKYPFWEHFPKIHNRIHLFEFVLPAMTKKEYLESKQKSKRVDVDIKSKKEDPMFLGSMRKSGIKKVF
jgi:hypothetical protein